MFVNPYGANSKDVPREPGFSKQDMLDYFAKHLKDGPEIKEKRTILYYTYGSGAWRETDMWPPRGIQEQTWYFGEGKTLSPRKPNSREGVDTYTVDFTASLGESNRWLAAPFVHLGVYHTYGKVDAQPLAPGEVAEIPITLQPISVVIYKGHRIRVAIAGHDAALKDRFPSTGTPQLSFQRNAVYPAGIKLPVSKDSTR